MKKLFLLLLLLVSLPVTAQDEVVREVCGVSFGDSFDVAKNKLEAYFKDKKSASTFAAISNKHVVFVMPELSHIKYCFEYYEDIRFDDMYFSFDEKNTLDHISFWINCEDESETQEKFLEVVTKLKTKYTLYSVTNENDEFAGYFGGKCYKHPNKCAFYIKVYKQTNVLLIFEESGF